MQELISVTDDVRLLRDDVGTPMSLPQTSSFSDRVIRGRALSRSFYLKESSMNTNLADALLESRSSSLKFGILKLVEQNFKADALFNEDREVRVHDVFPLGGSEFVVTFSDLDHFHNMVRYTYVRPKVIPSWDDYYGRSSDAFAYSEYLSRLYVLQQRLESLLKKHDLESLGVPANWKESEGVFRVSVSAWDLVRLNDRLRLKKIVVNVSYVLVLSEDKVVVLEDDGE